MRRNLTRNIACDCNGARMSKIKVLIASPYQLVRSGLRQLLNSSPHIDVVGEIGVTSKALVDRARALAPDVLLIVLEGDAPADLASVAAAVKNTGNTAVLVLTANENASFVRTTLATGARGYILKSASHTELDGAIRQVHRGHRYVDPRLINSIAELLLDTAASRRKPPPTPRLSAQEARVLRYIARGLTTREIAEESDLSPKTVETYRSRIYDKLGLRRRADLVQYAIAHGFLGITGERTSE